MRSGHLRDAFAAYPAAAEPASAGGTAGGCGQGRAKPPRGGLTFLTMAPALGAVLEVEADAAGHPGMAMTYSARTVTPRVLWADARRHETSLRVFCDSDDWTTIPRPAI